ncbi:MAG TPA: NAD(P)-binding domain-containing protein, partial [Solirubrobacterales bacterium]
MAVRTASKPCTTTPRRSPSSSTWRRTRATGTATEAAIPHFARASCRQQDERSSGERNEKAVPGPMTQIEKIAMVGLGNMGGRIARRIDGAGWDLSGYDADPEKRAGAEVATVDSLEQVAAADAIFFSLPDSRVVEIVVYGEGGL